MRNAKELWQSYGMPVAICFAVFSAINYVVNLFGLPHAIAVYLVSGSGLSLIFLVRSCRAGILTPRELGLGPTGWKPQHRLLGATLIVFFGYGGFVYLQDVAPAASVGDYFFWFVFLLPASLAELLVFVSIGFCLSERCLKEGGLRPLAAILSAGALSGVTFGLFHFTHEPRWHQYAFFLIPVMWLNLLYFTVTRNFHLTLLLHNTFAAVGFSQEQHSTPTPHSWVDPATYQTPREMTMIIVAFAVPYLLLHIVEAWLSRRHGASTIPTLAAPVEESTRAKDPWRGKPPLVTRWSTVAR